MYPAGVRAFGQTSSLPFLAEDCIGYPRLLARLDLFSSLAFNPIFAAKLWPDYSGVLPLDVSLRLECSGAKASKRLVRETFQIS